MEDGNPAALPDPPIHPRTFRKTVEISKTCYENLRNVCDVLRTSQKFLYAHIEIVVAFLAVILFVFLVIARHHEIFEGRH